MAETVETLGKYEIKGTLGKGAMGIVYEGWDPIIARRVAIKTVRIPEANDDPETEEGLARFRREAQAAGRLTHPNIVGVFDYGETGDIAYIVMEYVDGPAVKALLDKQERFAVQDTMRIMTDLLTGLQFSHARGVVHRDIKPANIMLTSEGQAKIADFGIARIESSSMTQAGTVMGTPAYMSPEQFMGQVVDARTDLYSSGVVLYQLLTGERPFEGGMSAIMHKALNTDPPLPSQISVTCPPAFDGIVRKAMAKRPEDRFQSAAEFLEALQAATSGRPVPGMPAAEAGDGEATMVAASPRRAAATTAAAGTGSMPARTAAATSAPAGVPPKRSPVPMIAVVVVVLLAVAGGGAWFFLLRGSGPTSVPAAQNTISTAPQVATNTPATPGPGSGTPTQPPATEPQATGQPNAAAPAPEQPTPAAETPAAQATTAAQTPAQPTSTAQTPAPPPSPAAEPTPPGQAPAPPPQQLASAGADTIRQQIADLALKRPCLLLDGSVQSNGDVTLTGFAGGSEADAVRQSLNSMAVPNAVDWQVSTVDATFCPALTVLAPIDPVFGARGAHLALGLAGGLSRLHDGQNIMPRVVMPNFRAWLVVDYVAHDGTLEHLYPQLADPSQKLAADPVREFQPGAVVNLGEPRPAQGHPGWVASPPYGTDMIIAIASSQPLFDHPRPGNVEEAATYLRALQQAVDAARQRGAELAGNAITVDTLPK